MKAIWKPLAINPSYQVSSNGDVRLEYTVEGVIRRRVLKQSRRNNYKTVTIVIDGKDTTKTVHVLVAEAFYRPLAENENIHHIDGNKKNNRLTNLVIIDKHEHNELHKKVNYF